MMLIYYVKYKKLLIILIGCTNLHMYLCVWGTRIHTYTYLMLFWTKNFIIDMFDVFFICVFKRKFHKTFNSIIK